MDGGRERRRQPDAAVAVPGALDLHRGKEERQRRRRHDVIDAERAVGAPALRPRPRSDAAVLARLHPRDRLTGRIARRRQRNRPEPAGLETLGDAGQRAVSAPSSRVPSTSRSGAVSTKLREGRSGYCRRRAAVHPIGSRASPRSRTSTRNTSSIRMPSHSRPVLHLLRERFLARRQKRRVDPTG